MKVNTKVQKLDPSLVNHFYKSYIYEGEVHLWCCASASRGHYEPEFNMHEFGSWEKVASWPIEIQMTDSAIEDIVVEWVLYCRRAKYDMDIHRIAELGMERIMEEAKVDNRDFDREKERMEREKERMERARVEKLAEVLTE